MMNDPGCEYCGGKKCKVVAVLPGGSQWSVYTDEPKGGVFVSPVNAQRFWSCGRVEFLGYTCDGDVSSPEESSNFVGYVWADSESAAIAQGTTMYQEGLAERERIRQYEEAHPEV